MIIEKLLENYELYKNELEADLYLLQRMLQQHMPEPSGDTMELGRILKHLKGCADFVNDAAVDHRLHHAEMRFRQLSYLDWFIRSRASEEQEVIKALWLDRLSLSEAADRLYVSKSSMYRKKQEVLSALEAALSSDRTAQTLWNEMEQTETI
jgi:predicted DNA-binding protein YlxM (UPF0122 family)